MRRVNGWFTLAWIGMIPISVAFGWLHSVAYVSALSLWALVSGHWSAWQAARTEVAQQTAEEREKRYPLADRVVDGMIRHTDVERSTA